MLLHPRDSQGLALRYVIKRRCLALRVMRQRYFNW